MIWRWGATQALALFLLGAAAALGHAPWHIPFMSLLCLGCAFYLILSLFDRPFLQGWFLGCGYFGVACSWIIEPFLVDVARHGWMAPFAWAGFCGGLALFWGAAAQAAAWISHKDHKLISAFAFGVMLTLFEWMRGYLFGGFAWGNLGYIWANTPIAQAAAWGGVYGLGGVSFIIALLPVGLGVRRGFAAALTLVFALWGAGQYRLNLAEVSYQDTTLRIVQPNAQQHQKWDPAYIPVFYNRLREATAAAPKVDFIIWPEQSLAVSINYAELELADIARQAAGTPVLLGARRWDEQDRVYNSAFVINPQAEVIARYDKYHLVPFGEYIPLAKIVQQLAGFGLASQGVGYTAGVAPQTLEVDPIGKIQILICYEAVFPRHIRRDQDRADLLVHMTNDAWFGRISGPYQHLVQAQFRAIEFGVPLARSANTGISAMIDPLGVIDPKAQLPLDQAGHFDALLPNPLPETFYARHGDGVLAMKLLVFLGLLSLRKYTRVDMRRVEA